MTHDRAVIGLKEIEALESPSLIAAPADDDLDGLRKGASMLARIEISDAVGRVLREDGRTLREIGSAIGLQAADLSRLARGKKGATVQSLAQIALGLGKSLKISIE